jgi:hypothetical protein
VVLRHKLNDVLETETQHVSVSQKKKVSVVRSMEAETCFLETRFRFHIKKTCFSFDRGWKWKRIAFLFPRKINRLQFPYSLSVVNSANDDPAKTKRVKRPVAELRG